MVFYYFGPDPSSWALGNDEFALANNLPPDIQKIWDELGEEYADKNMAGVKIQWMSTTTSGSYVIMSKTGVLYTNVDPLLEAVKANIHDFVGVDFASLSPLGGFFIRFSDSTVILSGQWPEKFMNLASSRLDIYNKTKQVSIVQRVFCVGDMSLIKTTAGAQWDGIPQAMADAIVRMTTGVPASDALEVGPNTALCPWSGDHWFLEAVPTYMGTTRYWHFLPDNGFSPEVINHLTRRERPPGHLIPRTYRLGERPGPPAYPPPRQDVPPTHQTYQPPPPPPRPDVAPTYPTYHSPPPNPMPPPPPRPTNTPTYQQPTANQPPPPPPPPPSRSTNPFRTDEETPAATISESDRQRFGQKFDLHAQGSSYINGTEAAVILLESGLDTKTLAEIWEIIDVDRNGKLDKEEFVAAMWHVESRLKPEASTVRYTEGHITCDGCRRGLSIGEEVYYCAVCNGGDFDLCSTCHFDYTKRCHHQLKQLTIQLQGHPIIREIPMDHVVCDGCSSKIYAGEFVHYCSVCNEGDYDICENCWQSQNVCGHALALRKLVNNGLFAETVGQDHVTSSYSAAPQNSSFTPTAQEPSDIDKLSKQFNDTKLKDSLMSSILTEKPNVKWDDVAGLEAAKGELQEAIVLPGRFPHLFTGMRRPRRAILLYGPPGTGKSYLAKAVATEVDHTLFSISSGDLMSKWMGESEGLMRQLFTLAREKKPSIIFIDEIDALCSNRDSGGANAEDTSRLKTELLVQMDGVGNKNDGVFFLAATNLPWALDPAIRRRFQKRIHVPLPDEKARAQLFKVHLGEMAAALGDVDYAFTDLAQRTNGFSGSDIANLVQDALMIPIKKIHMATHFKKTYDSKGEWYTPCSPDSRGAMPMKWSQVPGRQLREPPLEMRDLYDAVSKVKPSVGAEEIRKCHEWTEQYGMEG